MDKHEDKIVITHYNHGGARIFFEDDKGNSDLICDTYQDENFAQWMRDCARAYYRAETKQIMEAHTNQVLHDLRDDIDRNVGSWDSDCRFNECKQQVLKLVESYYSK